MTPKQSQPTRPTRPKSGGLDPFRRALLRGLAVLLPPLLTIAIFLWVGNTVVTYVLEPVESVTEWALVEWYADIKGPSDVPVEKASAELLELEGQSYRKMPDGAWVPTYVYDEVAVASSSKSLATTARGIYGTYMRQKHMQRSVVIPLFLCVFALLLYFIGRFLAAGVGRILWAQVEWLINSLPLVRNVYSSVKQVTDLMFSEQEMQFTRVVAIEYPRKGIWSLAMVTSEGFLDIAAAANEPVLAVLVPTSPMPFTGFTMTIKRSEAIDLNISIEDAIQFIVSCGVVVPANQTTRGTSIGKTPTLVIDVPADDTSSQDPSP